MPETIDEVLRNRSKWHTIATLPPRDPSRAKAPVSVSKTDLRKKQIRDEIEWRLEMLRIEQNHRL